MLVMKTDNADNHSPEKWATVTVDQFLSVDPASARAFSGLKLKVALVEILMEAFGNVTSHEKAELSKKDGAKRLGEGFHVPFVDETMAKMIAAAKDTGFADEFANGEYLNNVRTRITKMFANSMHVERGNMADRLDAEHGVDESGVSKNEHARAFRHRVPEQPYKPGEEAAPAQVAADPAGKQKKK